ncbi:hypothetical protein D1872_278620 [compost metagenome]
MGINPLLTQCKFSRHLRHAAFALTQKLGPYQGVPIEGPFSMSREQEGPIRLCQLCKVHDRVLCTLLRYIYRGLCSDQRNIRLIG